MLWGIIGKLKQYIFIYKQIDVSLTKDNMRKNHLSGHRQVQRKPLDDAVK